MEGFGADIKLLANLLYPNKDDEEEPEEYGNATSKTTILKAGDLEEKTVHNEEEKKDNPEEGEKVKRIERPREDWEYDFIAEPKDDGQIFPRNDWKATPKWDISYRQSVTASDVFLQMGGKTPTSASCENMIVKVELPGESRPNIDLKVFKEKLEVTSPRFYLNVPLPQPVNPQLGNAQYDTDTECLNINLVMEREFDFLNF